MNMLEIFKEISNNYGKGEYKDNFTASVIRKKTQKMIPANMLDKNYIVKGSAGQGGWAEIPWIGIFDKDISISAQSGFDIVYLFTNDYKEVYLSLNQGWTYFSKNYSQDKKQYIQKVSRYWQSNLKTLNGKHEIHTASINLNKLNKNKVSPLLKGYELGNIVSKRYVIKNLKDNNALLRDLNNMITIFKELKSNLINQSYKSTISYILSLNEDEIEDLRVEKDTSLIEYDLKSLVKNLKESSIPDKSLKMNPKKYKLLDFKKKDYIKEAKNNSKIGFKGEEIVLEFEKKYLSSVGLDSLISQLDHHSIRNDAAGYDIISFRLDKSKLGYKKKYIEVKTTTGNKNTPFYLSNREILASQEFKEDYLIYRIYSINSLENMGYYTIEGPLTTKNLQVEVESVRALPKIFK